VTHVQVKDFPESTAVKLPTLAFGTPWLGGQGPGLLNQARSGKPARVRRLVR
jgi:hypothetical protein